MSTGNPYRGFCEWVFAQGVWSLHVTCEATHQCASGSGDAEGAELAHPAFLAKVQALRSNPSTAARVSANAATLPADSSLVADGTAVQIECVLTPSPTGPSPGGA
jgi:hypothetical protein